ncbi:MAG: ATP-dependent Clp protease ATP-binding subunit [Acidobacteria bacterium]|nr:ATP-dependent Clp protease ATP-binding subunit [Acidobacteriota bacterium]
MPVRLPSIVVVDSQTLAGRLLETASRLGAGPMDPAELEHLVEVVTHCSALLRDVYTEQRLGAILSGNLLRLPDWPPLVAPLTEGDDDLAVLGRLRGLPEEVREVGDKALFDVALTGLDQVHGVPLLELGPRAYRIAAEVLAQMADDARLRGHFVHNRLGRQSGLEDEVKFLRRCSERFDLYSRLLRQAGEDAGQAAARERASAATAPIELRGRPEPPLPPPPPKRAPRPAAAPESAAPGSATTQKLAAYERLLLFAGLDLDRLRADLEALVVDQQEAIATLCDDLALFAVGTQGLLRPASYFLVGPTGVGKNYLVEMLVENLRRQWQVEVPLLTIEGPNYTYPSDINELRGATRGFIRSDEPGLLTEFHARAENSPLSMILVDEVEKAHPQLRRFFLGILDRGTTTDAHGNELGFAGCLIFFTSNIGHEEGSEGAHPIGFGGLEIAEAAYRSELSRSLRRSLSPEFINRTKIVRFRHLPRSSAERIVGLEFDKIAARYREMHGLELELTPAARDLLLELGYSYEYGARHVAAVLHRTCNVEIGKMIRRDEGRPERHLGELLALLRGARASGAELEPAELERRVLEEARARVVYRRIVVDAEDGKLVYRREELA